MKTKAAATAITRSRSSRRAYREERVGNPIRAPSESGLTRILGSGRLPGSGEGRGGDIPLAPCDDGIKSEKGGMKYIRFLIRRGANGEAYPAGGPRGRIRHVFSRRRGHRLAVRPRPAQPLVSPDIPRRVFTQYQF